MTSQELPKFFEALNEERNENFRDFIWLALLTGARKSNVLSMKWSGINFQDKSWYIEETKNDTSHLIPLVNEAIEILKVRNNGKNGEKWVFPSKTSASGHLEEPKKVWKKVLKRATCKIWIEAFKGHKILEKARKVVGNNDFDGIKLFEAIINLAKKYDLELPTGILDVRFHDLRRTLGSWLAHSGASQYVISKSLNHKSVKSTAVYARLSIDPVRESMKEAVRMMRGK